MEPHSVVFTGGERPGFNVSVVNAGEEGFELGVDNIRVHYNQAPLEVLDEETLATEAKFAKFFKDLAGYASIAAVAVGAYSLDYSASDFLTDPQLRLFTDQMNNIFKQNAEELRLSLKQYRETTLETQLVAPGNQHGGYFLAEKPNSMKDQGFFEVTVDVGGETHNFRFETDKVGN